MLRACITGLLLLALAACGGVSFRGAILQLGNGLTTSGTVSIVQLTVISGSNGTDVDVTLVTLLQPGSAQNLTFCGTQNTLFPMNTFVQVQFLPGANCSNIVLVTQN